MHVETSEKACACAQDPDREKHMANSMQPATKFRAVKKSSLVAGVARMLRELADVEALVDTDDDVDA